MALTCASMAAEVQALAGRTGDTVLVTTDQIKIWFNEAQRDIVDRVPGLQAMGFKNRTSLDTTDTIRYAIADLTMDLTTQAAAAVHNVFYLDGAESRRLNFVHTDEFDDQWADPTHADAPRDKPHWWTRRGQYIEIVPLCASGYWDDDLRFDGDFYAADFTAGESTAYSDLCEADEGLKYYALSKAWRSIGNMNKAVDYSQQYEFWLDNYEHKNNRLNEWDGNLYSDDIA